MTAIAIWRNDEVSENPSLWAAADSLVSGQAGQSLIADAVKILSLPIICRGPDLNGFLNEVYFAHTLGYCYAGSTLMGQNAYLGLSMLLSNLTSRLQYVPSVQDVANYVLKYLRLTFRDYGLNAGNSALFEVGLFGYCHRTQRLEIFALRPEIVNGLYDILLEPHQNLNNHDFVYFGDNKEILKQEILNAFAGEPAPGRPISRAPRFVIQDRIESHASPTIGGDLQLAIADRSGLQTLQMVKPRVPGQLESYFSFLGRELTEDLTNVGEAFALPRMSIT